MKKTEIQTYKSIEDLILYNWDRYLATKDNNWFIIDYDGRQKKIESEVLNNLEISLQDEYFKEIDDINNKIKIQKWAKIQGLYTRYNAVEALIYRISLGFGNEQMALRAEFINKLNNFGYKVPLINSIDGDFEEITKVQQQNKGIITQIKILQDELKDDAVEDKRSLSLQLRLMTKAFGFTVALNAKELTVKEHIELSRELKELSKKN
jgi:hypothetical protein